MQTRSNSSSINTLLIVVLIVITFPFWIGLIGGVFGLIAGVFGAVFGIIGSVFGAVFGAIGSIFGVFFGGHWGWPGFHFFGGNFLFVALIILCIVLLSRRKK